MTPQSSPDAHSSGGFVQSAAAYGVAAPRPGLLLVVLLLIAACIVVLTAIDLATMSARIASLTSSLDGTKLPVDALRSSQLNSSLFIAAFMAGVLALIAFGHNWARWVWLSLCMLVGLLVALGTVVLMFGYAPEAAMFKCAVYLVLFVLSCMLFSPSSNAWFRQIKEIRNNPRLRPAAGGASPAPGQLATPADGQPYHPYAPPGGMPAGPAAPVAIPPRPRTISLALALFVLNALLGMVLTVLYLPDVFATQNAVLGEGMMKNLAYGGIAFGIILMVIMLYYIARGSNVARWIWTAMAVLGFLNAYAALKMAFVISPTYGALLSLSQLLSLAGTILLFVPASSAWIRAVTLARNK
ncbi:hypothetical protein F2P45_02165 [Massilia sp. CCM 8733]|uniref:Uncharacterized protein n=1 Tax=Massilia mucilaginosa TaxID=2609282 RepID=A0ABX0NLZ2_9BURK|nr:hypothetical protein [Massilia mucilaginosa]NHZ87841.1 hypothetical protein [Massilia mucilaginosa]